MDHKVEELDEYKDKPNLSFKQLSALKQLKNKRHLIIKKADKGSACVIMNKCNYIIEATRQLSNEKHYKKISEPIYPQTAIEYENIIKSMEKKKFIHGSQMHYLLPKENARPRHFYLLPKIHKDMSKWTIKDKMPPGRPIVSDCSSESYRIAEYIDHHLQPLSKLHQSYVEDTNDFLKKIRNLQVPDNAFLVTLDIESLYTNIQTKDGLAAVKIMLDEHPKGLRPDKELLKLLELNLNCNDFLFNNEWYLQVSGTAMGKKFAPAYANITMAVFEAEVMKKIDKKPLAYFRYLDDIFMIWPHSLDDFQAFFNILNNHRESIKFQYNINDNSVDFLDVTIFKGNVFKHEKKLDTKVYFKDTDTHELLHKSSFHPKHTFKGIIKSQLIRFWKICSDTTSFHKACSTLFNVLQVKRHYSSRFLRQIKSNAVDLLTACRSLISPVGVGTACGRRRCECCLYVKTRSVFDSKYAASEFTITGKLDCNSKNIVYLIECKKCEEQYVGETSKSLRGRLTDHLSDIRRYCETSVAEHFNQIDHDITDLQITPIVQLPDEGSQFSNSLARRKQESFFIDRLNTMTPNGMNEKLEQFHKIAFPIIYCNKSTKITRIIRDAYTELQSNYPKHFKNDLITAYKRNRNLADLLVSSRLQ